MEKLEPEGEPDIQTPTDNEPWDSRSTRQSEPDVKLEPEVIPRHAEDTLSNRLGN